ncbi:hypothetical protein KP509_1Z152300 [Ceratopteris richardii]|nr:hypothetical protein KP509_1Z152300 [Ceratopteris richardii]
MSTSRAAAQQVMTIKGGDPQDQVLRKGPWMPEEDEILVEYVNQYGPRDWSSIRSKGLLPRTGKSCRLRWVNKLKPDLKSGCKFSPEEEKLVVEMQAKLGNKWAKIASYLPGRTDNDVKNFWSTRQKRLLRALQRPAAVGGATGNVMTAAGSSTSPSTSSSCKPGDGVHFAHFLSHTDPLLHDSMLDPLGKNHCFNEFAAFQMQSPTRSGGTAMNPGSDFMQTLDEADGEGGLFIRGQPVGDLRRLRHPGGGFNMACKTSQINVSDDGFMVKLQDLVPNESVAAFMESSDSANSKMQESNTVPTSKNSRSAKNRKPRSRREPFRPGFESITAENRDMHVLLASSTDDNCVHDMMASSNVLTQPTNDVLMQNCGIMALQSTNLLINNHDQTNLGDCQTDIKPPHELYGLDMPVLPTCPDENLDVFLNMQLPYDSSACSTAPTTASTISAGGRPDSPGLGGLCELPPFAISQWDKLPLLYPDEPSLPIQPDCCNVINIKEEVMDSSSCSPDSVLVSFPSDVFDSLEPLSGPSSSSDWWQN